MSKDIAVIYHNNCNDGFGAALAAYKLFGDQAVYIPMNYGVDEIPPEAIGPTQVYMLDFSMKRSQLEVIANTAQFFKVIDHHESAQIALEGAPYAQFDMNHSGAAMAWKYFHNGVPPLIQHIEDRDLWKFLMEGTAEVHCALESYPYDFEVWMKLLEVPIPELIIRGAGVKDFRAILMEKILKEVNFVDIASYKNIPLVNTTVAHSEVAHEMLQRYLDAPFVMYRHHRADGITQVGLRSRNNEDINVFEIAQCFGGGGHKHAAGFTFKEREFMEEYNCD